MANLMPFGTRNRLAMIPCPQSTFARTITRSREEYAMGNAAVAVKSGRMARRKYNFTWLDSLANLLPVLEMGQENSGPPYYFLDPGALANGWNALPSHWSAPGWAMNANGGVASDFVGQFALMNKNDGVLSDGTVSTPGAYVSAINCPDVGVQLTYPVVSPPYAVKDQASGGVSPYFLDSGVLKATHVCATVIVPPSYKFALRITADFTGQAGLCYSRRTAGINGRFSSIWATTVSRVTLTSGVTTPATFTNTSSQWSTVDIWFGGNTTATTGGVLSLYGLEAYVLPAAGSIPANFQEGVGSMPLWPSDEDMEVSVYSVAATDNNKLHGVSWSMMEADIPW
jgi:hypothetical protein